MDEMKLTFSIDKPGYLWHGRVLGSPCRRTRVFSFGVQPRRLISLLCPVSSFPSQQLQRRPYCNLSHSLVLISFLCLFFQHTVLSFKTKRDRRGFDAPLCIASPHPNFFPNISFKGSISTHSLFSLHLIPELYSEDDFQCC